MTSTSHRSCYVSNPFPSYHSPGNGAKKPAIIRALVTASCGKQPARHPVWRTAERFHAITHMLLSDGRAMNEHRARAINAICACIADRLNIVEGKVYMTLGQISDSCGLTTWSNGVPSYSRACRAINEHLEAIGAIHCERIWDETTGSWIPNIIWVTELFFTLIGFEYGKYLAAQQQQLAWRNKQLLENGETAITVTEARRRAKERHIKIAFEIRARKHVWKTQIKRAKKLASMDEQKARQKILTDLVKLYGKGELAAIGHSELKRQIDERYQTMRKLAESPYQAPDTP
ncbi:Replication initiation protein (plasmid) [Serratia symbiotica]|nr:Replication initiation protein [Serratia symbiotica]